MYAQFDSDRVVCHVCLSIWPSPISKYSAALHIAYKACKSPVNPPNPHYIETEQVTQITNSVKT